jgi:hypothetical protein
MSHVSVAGIWFLELMITCVRFASLADIRTRPSSDGFAPESRHLLLRHEGTQISIG